MIPSLGRRPRRCPAAADFAAPFSVCGNVRHAAATPLLSPETSRIAATSVPTACRSGQSRNVPFADPAELNPRRCSALCRDVAAHRLISPHLPRRSGQCRDVPYDAASHRDAATRRNIAAKRRTSRRFARICRDGARASPQNRTSRQLAGQRGEIRFAGPSNGTTPQCPVRHGNVGHVAAFLPVCGNVAAVQLPSRASPGSSGRWRGERSPARRAGRYGGARALAAINARCYGTPGKGQTFPIPSRGSGGAATA